MSSERQLYEQVILDHNKTPRNFEELEDATAVAEGYNPLCGDRFKVFLKTKDGKIEKCTFQGAGCAISKSSASVMTTILQGKTLEEARQLFTDFKGMLTSDTEAPLDKDKLGKLMVFSGVREFPVRIKCANLAWHTMLSALDGEAKVTTE